MENTITLFEGLAAKSTNEIVKQIINNIEEGQINPSEVAFFLKNIDDLHKALKTKAQDYIVNELHTNGSTEFKGKKIEKFTTGERLSYEHNEDWLAIENAKKELSERQKPIEQKMKLAYKNGFTIVDEDSGEVYQPAKHKSGGADSYKIVKA